MVHHIQGFTFLFLLNYLGSCLGIDLATEDVTFFAESCSDSLLIKT